MGGLLYPTRQNVISSRNFRFTLYQITRTRLSGGRRGVGALPMRGQRRGLGRWRRGARARRKAEIGGVRRGSEGPAPVYRPSST